jgi:hypothetical protein
MEFISTEGLTWHVYIAFKKQNVRNAMKHILALTALLLSGTASLAQQGVPGAHFIENWDADGNGSVSEAEVAQKRTDVFAAFDADENGSLSAEEYAVFDEARANDQAQMGGGHGMGMKNLEAPMERGFNDTNGDGEVSAEEWAAASPRMFTALDKNGDGEITSADFGNH